MQAAIAEMVDTERTEALTMRHIATKIGVSAPALYIHFASKESLLFEASERIAAAGIAMRDALANSGNPVVDLMVRMGGVMTTIHKHPDVYRTLMMTDYELTPAEYRGDKVFDMVPFQTSLAAIRAAQAGGNLDIELDPHMTTLLILFVMHGYLSLRLTKPDLNMPDNDDLLRAMSLLIIKGLGGDVKLVDDIVERTRTHRISGGLGTVS